MQRDQFSKKKEENQEIAKLRIHAKRAIRLVKEYHMFDCFAYQSSRLCFKVVNNMGSAHTS